MTTTSDGIISYSEPINQSGNPYNLVHADVIEWARTYKGRPFHAFFSDVPYHLTTITKRFGKKGSKPPKFGKDGAFARASRGFMQTTWDGGDLAFRPDTWAAFKEHLYPGAFGMAFASSRGWHRLAIAIEGLAGIPVQEIKSMADLLAAARETKDWGIVERVENWLRGYTGLSEAIEKAGFIIHPSLFGWAYLSGWPKATRIDTQIDKAAGVDREVIGNYGRSFRPHADQGNVGWQRPSHDIDGDITAPATPLAKTWEGHRYGLQALKPALEPIIVFQKPYEGRPIDNITQTGAGALNIDAGRIQTADSLGGGGYMTPVSEGWDRPWKHNEDLREEKERLLAEHVAHAEEFGRWPANFYLQHTPDCNGSCPPHCPVRLLDKQSGNRPAGSSKTGNEPSEPTKNTYSKRNPVPFTGHGDNGGASRIFYQADWSYEVLEQLEQAEPVYYAPKVSQDERDAGLDDLPTRIRHRVNSGGLENEPRFAPIPNKNTHPCLKPISLTRYLAGLLLPPDPYAPRRLLVPFSGSGSEMIGGILAGWEEVVGIEKYPVPEKPISQENPDYIGIAEARLAWWSEWLKYGKPEVEAILAAKEASEQQLRMF